jgi:hypothetical protein
MSKLNETIKAVCEAHKVDFVFLSEDDQIFLPKAEYHCKNHCNKNQLSYKKLTADGTVVPEKKEDTGHTPEPEKEITEASLKKLNKKALQAMLDGKVEFSEDNTKAELIEMILKLEEGSSEDGEPGEGKGAEEGSEETETKDQE